MKHYAGLDLSMESTQVCIVVRTAEQYSTTVAAG